MEHFAVYTPKVAPTPPAITIIDLIPVGRDNAISRDYLVAHCVNKGLVDQNSSLESQDRAMRRLLEKARLDYTVLNLSRGEGYYRPARDDLQDLQRYIRQEENRAKSTFRNISNAKALYEDYMHGRIGVD
jgi:hypothetical protein